jgi:long-chain fatty acid transport protein
MALAGTAVEPDASVQFENPAGIAALSGFNVLGGGNIYVTSVDFHNQGSKSVTGAPLTGDASADSNAVAPYGYASYQIDDQLTAGLAVYTPFGLATRYPDNSSVRYFSETTSLRTIEINPNIAFRLNDQLSIGAGPAIRYTDAELSQAVDDGGIATGLAVARGASPLLAAAASGPEANDARFRAKGDDWDVGYKAGILYQPDKLTSIGLAYHSAMESTVSGNAVIDNSGVSSPGAVAFATSPFALKSSTATAKIDYPDYITLSGSHQLTDDLRLAADFEWTDFSRVKGLYVQFANGQPSQGEAFNWNDAYRFSVGAEYKVAPQWTLRGGTAFEISPVSSDTERVSRDPDSDRFWLSAGFGYAYTQNISFDFGYSHLFTLSGGSFQSSSTAGTLVGEYEDDSADIISADVTYHF